VTHLRPILGGEGHIIFCIADVFVFTRDTIRTWTRGTMLDMERGGGVSNTSVFTKTWGGGVSNKSVFAKTSLMDDH